MVYRITACTALACLSPTLVIAQTEQTTLAPVVVTASREPEPAGEALANVTVINREDIEREQPQSVLDLLRTQSGIDVARTGGLGSVTSVFMRGAESDQTLVLIDGVRATSTASGTFAFEHLDPSQIERIEIVRGPRSTLYGSDAIGGVIQIFTRKLNGPTAAVEAGSYDTYRAEAGYGGGDAVRYSVNGAYANSGGFSATNPNVAFDFDPDDDGYEERSATANVDAALTEDANLSLNGWHSDAETQFDMGELDTRNDTVGLNLALETLPTWRQTFAAGYASDDQDSQSLTFPSETNTNRVSFSWQNDVSLSNAHQLTAGVDYYRDAGEFAGPLGSFDESAHDIGGYLNLRSALGANDLQAGLRYDEHSAFGGHATGQIALGRAFTDSLKAFAAFGTAFKAPTLNELFFPIFGNPDLDPEASRSTELGLEFQSGAQGPLVRASVFYTEIDDLIEVVFVGPGPNDFIGRNVNEATIRGLELGVDMNLAARWRVSAGLTLQNARNDTEGTDLLRRPDRKLVFSVSRDFARGGSFHTEVLLSSDRLDVGGERLPGYGVVNLGLQYPLTENLYADARVENLLDKDYELAAGYNTPDLSGYLGLRYAPAGE